MACHDDLADIMDDSGGKNILLTMAAGLPIQDADDHGHAYGMSPELSDVEPLEFCLCDD